MPHPESPLSADAPRALTGRHETSRDFYETAAWQVDALTDHLPELAGVVCGTLCRGTGRCSRACGRTGPTSAPSSLNDLDATRSAAYHLDATRTETWATMPATAAALTGSSRTAVQCRARHPARGGDRTPGRGRRGAHRSWNRLRTAGPGLGAHPCDKRITLERCSFTGNGKSDSVTTEWLVWARAPLARPFNVSAFGYRRRARGGEQPQLFDWSDVVRVGRSAPFVKVT